MTLSEWNEGWNNLQDYIEVRGKFYSCVVIRNAWTSLKGDRDRNKPNWDRVERVSKLYNSFAPSKLGFYVGHMHEKCEIIGHMHEGCEMTRRIIFDEGKAHEFRLLWLEVFYNFVVSEELYKDL